MLKVIFSVLYSSVSALCEPKEQPDLETLADADHPYTGIQLGKKQKQRQTHTHKTDGQLKDAHHENSYWDE